MQYENYTAALVPRNIWKDVTKRHTYTFYQTTKLPESSAKKKTRSFWWRGCLLTRGVRPTKCRWCCQKRCTIPIYWIRTNLLRKSSSPTRRKQHLCWISNKKTLKSHYGFIYWRWPSASGIISRWPAIYAKNIANHIRYDGAIGGGSLKVSPSETVLLWCEC